jgi:hypothetical protein
MDMTDLVREQIKEWLRKAMPSLVIAALRKENAEIEANKNKKSSEPESSSDES